MKTRSLTLITQCLAGLGVLAASCSDDEEDFLGPPTPVVGTWSATSVTVNGEDLIANGMILNATFDDSGVYVFHVIGDAMGLCGEGVSECDVTGAYTATTTQITLNPGEGQIVINYVTTGETMTLTGALTGVDATIVLDKF